jgi:uncharacterized protein YycO
MRKTVMSVIGVLLIAGSAVQMTTASARASRHETATQQFRNSNNSIDSRASTWCSTEPGNPYNPQTDYQAWSAWRALGAWDSRNDCQ